MANFVIGANEVGYHVVNTNIPRDFSVTRIADIALAQDGATCVWCGGTLRAEPAVELAHCVKVGAVSIKQGGIVTYLNANGHAQPVMLGRCMVHLDGVMQAIIEEHHDEQGIVWPRAVAPYEVHLVAIAKDEASAQAAETLYGELRASGVEVLYDDRNLSPGVMFADADLMGIPLRLTVSPRSLDSDGIEAKWRWESERTMIPLAEAVEQVRRLMEKSR
jgi:prolyl-tRNA synthetase